MSKAFESWKNLEQSVARLEATLTERAISDKGKKPSPSQLEGLERMNKLIHKLEAWRKSA